MATLFAIAGCAPSDRAADTPRPADGSETVTAPDPNLSIVEGQTPSEAQRQKMLEAKDALFTALSGRLIEAMTEGGPVAAISVCQREAPEIARRVGETHGVNIGRTGVRLRNPSNVPPGWAKALVEDKTEVPTFATLSNGDAAALLPIRLQAQCLMCHGPTEQIDPAVKQQLAELYPNDAATGFQEGELRGWFWIRSAAESAL
jgi:hypothetical protein